MSPCSLKTGYALVWMTTVIVCVGGVVSVGVAQERVEARVAHQAVVDAEASLPEILVGHKQIAAVPGKNGGQKIPIVVVVIAGAIALVAGIILMVRHFEKKRTAALDVIASEIGLLRLLVLKK